MNDPNPNPWPAALEMLRGQMTQATYDTWLQGTAATVDSNTLTIHVASTYAQEWLEHKLHKTISRAVTSVAGQGFEIRYQVGGGPEPAEPERRARPEPGPGEFSVSLVSFDPAHWGQIVTQRYVLVFWQPLLGYAFQVWVTLRTFTWNNEAEGWPSIQLLADICANGNRHRLLGRAARADRAAQTGALETLTQARIIHIRTQGQGRKTQYFFRVLDSLPLLTPHQVEHLTPALQERHKQWLWKCSIDYEEWQQLTFESLLEPEE